MKKIDTRIIIWPLLLVALFELFGLLYYELNISCYMHDSLYYIQTQQVYYLNRLQSEGRWLIYLLFYPLKALPGPFAALLSLGAFALFVAILTREIGLNSLYRLILVVALLLVPAHYSQLLWPATSLLSYLLLAAAALSFKRLNSWLFFALFGLLFHGAIAQFYFLLLLLFMPSQSDNSLKSLFASLLLPYGVGFVFGHLVSNGFVYFVSGHTIHIESWRGATSIDSFGALVAHLQNSLNLFLKGLKEALGGEIGIALYAIAIATWSLITKPSKLILLLLGIVAVSLFVAIIPYGITLHSRSLLPLYTALLLLPVVASKHSRAAAFLLVGLFSIWYGYRDIQNLRWFNTTTQSYITALKELKNQLPIKTDALVLYQEKNISIASLTKAIKKEYGLRRFDDFEPYDNFRIWQGSAIEAGFTTVGWCHKNSHATRLFQVDNALGALCSYITTHKLGAPEIKTELFRPYGIISQRLVITPYLKENDEK